MNIKDGFKLGIGMSLAQITISLGFLAVVIIFIVVAALVTM
jgi:hypothetical protein